jgi:hypothetical protein
MPDRMPLKRRPRSGISRTPQVEVWRRVGVLLDTDTYRTTRQNDIVSLFRVALNGTYTLVTLDVQIAGSVWVDGLWSAVVMCAGRRQECPSAGMAVSNT